MGVVKCMVRYEKMIQKEYRKTVQKLHVMLFLALSRLCTGLSRRYDCYKLRERKTLKIINSAWHGKLR